MDYILKAKDKEFITPKESMHLILPLHHKIAEPVKNWREVKKEALEMVKFIDAKNFKGYWEDAYAISHAQVSNNPKKMFVLNAKKEKRWGGRIIINLKIRKSSDPSIFPEGCMSFMFRQMKRVERFAHIDVTYWTPFMNLFLIPHWKHFKNIDAFIAQHENDHANGINIYGI